MPLKKYFLSLNRKKRKHSNTESANCSTPPDTPKKQIETNIKRQDTPDQQTFSDSDFVLHNSSNMIDKSTLNPSDIQDDFQFIETSSQFTQDLKSNYAPIIFEL